MRFLLIYAHPEPASFDAAIHASVLRALRRAGHDVDDCDLYAEGFDPVLSRETRAVYEQSPANRKGVEAHVERLLACEGLCFVFPTWNFGMPAILKGYFDRVWLPGVSFEVVNGHARPLLGHIKRYGVVTTYGAPRWVNSWVAGDPGKKAFMRGMRQVIARRARTLWMALYGMDSNTERDRQRFLATVERRFERFAR